MVEGLLLLMSVRASAAFDRFLDPGLGTRSMALAGASSALADDAFAMAANPAAGIFLGRAMAGLSTGFLVRGKAQSLDLAAVLPRVHGAALGFGYSYLGGEALGGGQDHQVQGSAAMPVDPSGRLAAGASFKLLRGGSRDFAPAGSVSGAGLNFGLLYRAPLKGGKGFLNSGFSVQGAATSLRWSGGVEEKVPALFDLGFAYAPWPASAFCLDLTSADKARDGRPLSKSLRLGAEHRLRGGLVSIRAGYARRYKEGDQVAFGLGYRPRGSWSADYALAAEGQGRGVSHRLSGSYEFSVLPFQSDRVISGELEAQRLALAEAELGRLRQRQAELSRLLDAGRKDMENSSRELEVMKTKLADVQALKAQVEKLTADIDSRDLDIQKLNEDLASERERAKARREAAPPPQVKPKPVEIDQNLIRARELLRREDYLEAIKAYEKVLAANPRDAEARRDIRASLEKVPKEKLYSPEDLALYQKAIGQQTRGEFENAIQSWKEFLAKHPYALQVEDYLNDCEATLKRIQGGT